MFIITKHIHGKPRNYAYEAYRDEKTGKPKRRYVAYLGEHEKIESCYLYNKKEIPRLKRRLALAEHDLKTWENYCEDHEYSPSGRRRFIKSTIKPIQKKILTIKRTLSRAEKLINALRPHF